jgi:hypothetical protein
MKSPLLCIDPLQKEIVALDLCGIAAEGTPLFLSVESTMLNNAAGEM